MKHVGVQPSGGWGPRSASVTVGDFGQQADKKLSQFEQAIILESKVQVLGAHRQCMWVCSFLRQSGCVQMQGVTRQLIGGPGSFVRVSLVSALSWLL